jgi:hypothetical protein
MSSQEAWIGASQVGVTLSGEHLAIDADLISFSDGAVTYSV